MTQCWPSRFCNGRESSAGGEHLWVRLLTFLSHAVHGCWDLWGGRGSFGHVCRYECISRLHLLPDAAEAYQRKSPKIKQIDAELLAWEVQGPVVNKEKPIMPNPCRPWLLDLWHRPKSEEMPRIPTKMARRIGLYQYGVGISTRSFPYTFFFRVKSETCMLQPWRVWSGDAGINMYTGICNFNVTPWNLKISTRSTRHLRGKMYTTKTEDSPVSD